MQPNILIITIDALRHDRVGVFDGRQLTPHIDKFANESTIFTNAYSTTNTTDPAVTSIQTGRYPLSHGVVNHGRRVTPEEKQSIEQVRQLPEILSAMGFRTAKFGRPLGRWHRNGFDRYPEQMESRTAFDEQEQEQEVTSQIGDLLEAVHPTARAVASSIHHTVSNLFSQDDRTIEDVDEFDDWDDPDVDHVLQNFTEWINGSNPFYAFVHLMDTHGPYTAPPDLVHEYLNRFDYSIDTADYTGWEIPDAFHKRVLDGQYPDIREKYYYGDTPSTAVIDASYDASVTVADMRVHHFLMKLKERGLYNNTLLILLADHGESLTEHGIYYDHHGLYEVSIRIPLLIRSPNGNTKQVDDLVQITDIAPTILSYVDGSNKLQSDGVSLKPVVESNKTIKRNVILAEEAHTQRRRMILNKNKKLIYLVSGDTVCRYCDVQHAPKTELYDINNDPYEWENIATEQSEFVDSLREIANEKIDGWNKKRPDIQNDEKIEYEDEEKVAKRLEALGYK
jgi:arylsulfatase A-like enzyme